VAGRRRERGVKRGNREKEKERERSGRIRESAADQGGRRGGRAPFEGGLLNFQGHSRGPVARRREKARGRRAKGTREGREREKERARGWYPGERGGGRSQTGTRHENSLLNLSLRNACARFRPIGPVSPGALGPRQAPIDVKQRRRRLYRMRARALTRVPTRRTSFRGPGKGPGRFSPPASAAPFPPPSRSHGERQRNRQGHA